jgi:trigger factor
VTIKQVQQLKLPELSPEFLQILGCDNEEALNNLIRSALERQLEYEQRQAAREQVLQKIAAAATWDLPSDLLHRQAQRNLSRRILEMRNAGFSEDEIRARANLLRQDILDSTARGLKEHFVLQKIAEVEKIEVGDEDVNEEIESIARQADESPRKVRARLEREDMMETLMMEVLERKALDLVLASATYEDVPFVSQGPATAAVEGTASGIEPEPAPPLATPNEPAAAGALPGR